MAFVTDAYPLSWKREPVHQDLEVSQSCGERNYLYFQSNANVPIVLFLPRLNAEIDIYKIGILLLSTNQTVDEFRHTLEHIEKLNDTYSANGPVMILLGDFNAHLSHGYGDKNPVKLNEHGRVIE